MEGFIILHRQVLDNELWRSERFTKAQAWIELLLLANHTSNTIFIRGNELRTERGELCYSMVSLARRWKWNRRTVNNFLSWLESRQMIHTRKTSLTTVISITNYSLYQDPKQQTANQTAQQSSSRMHTNNNDNNDDTPNPLNTSHQTNSGLLKFSEHLSKLLRERGYPYNDLKIVLWMRKDFEEYGGKALQEAFNKTLRWLDKGNEVKSPISYGLGILKKEFKKLSE